MVALLEGQPLDDGVEFAVVASEMAVGAYGGQAGYPTRERRRHGSAPWTGSARPCMLSDGGSSTPAEGSRSDHPWPLSESAKSCARRRNALFTSAPKISVAALT